MITIQIKIRKKLNFVKNVGSAVLWISQKVPPFFGLTKKFRRSLDWSKRYAIIAQRYRHGAASIFLHASCDLER